MKKTKKKDRKKLLLQRETVRKVDKEAMQNIVAAANTGGDCFPTLPPC